MLRQPSSRPSGEAGIDRRLIIAMCGCSAAAGVGLLYLSLGRPEGWTTAWVPLATGFSLALACAGAWFLRAGRRRPPAQGDRPSLSDVSFAHPEVWREIDGNRDLLYALLELSRRRMRDTTSRAEVSMSPVGANDASFAKDRAK